MGKLQSALQPHIRNRSEGILVGAVLSAAGTVRLRILDGVRRKESYGRRTGGIAKEGPRKFSREALMAQAPF